MKQLKQSLIILIFTVTAIGCITARNRTNGPNVPPRRLEYTYAQLMLRDMDELKRLIAKRMNDGDAAVERDLNDTEEAIANYQNAVRILFSRPDQDGARSPIFTEMRKRLADVRGLDRVLQELTDEAIGAIRSDDAPTVEKATYVHLLENLMAEIKPEVNDNPNFRDILMEIRDARLVLDSDVRSNNMLRSMDPLFSPSRTAQGILERAGANKPKGKTKR